METQKNGAEMETKFNPQAIENDIYQAWETSGAFTAHRVPGKKPFTIVMPPPNITGQLHMGHAMDCTPAGRGHSLPSHEGRPDPVAAGHGPRGHRHGSKDCGGHGQGRPDQGQHLAGKPSWSGPGSGRTSTADALCTSSGSMGVSCDWSRERFTMDEGCSRAVRETFCRLYEKGLMYRGNRLVNWCPCCQTSISDAEVEYKEQDGHFWHLLYPVKETGEMLELATTRPETMLGDTAVAMQSRGRALQAPARLSCDAASGEPRDPHCAGRARGHGPRAPAW